LLCAITWQMDARSEDYLVVYNQYIEVAQYVVETDVNDNYKWLSDHFYFNSLKAAVKIGMSDGGHILAEACCNVGKIFESRGIVIVHVNI
jgi:hypothetical protein